MSEHRSQRPDEQRAGGQRGRGQRGGQRRGTEQRGDRQRPREGAEQGPRRSAQRPADRARSGDQPRLTAYTVLRAVAEGAYANLALPQELRKRHLHGRDAAFATELTFGTIREQGLYDAIITRAADRPLDRLDARVLDTLRLGVHQVLGMRVAEHAACGETVALSRQVNGAGAAGLVNAVLRRVCEHDRAQWVEIVTEGLEPVEAMSVRHSHPAWVVRALRAALISSGTARETVDAETEALLAKDNEPAKVTLVARPGLAELDEIIQAGAEPTVLSPIGARLDHGDPGSIRAVREHRAAVQDEGSQLLALALAQVPVEGTDARWLDLCAGPGGKAALLASLARERGASLLANEVSEHRAELVRQSVEPVLLAGGEVELRTGDGRTLEAELLGSFDRVLVDAPCTGLGALRRRPEARWRRTPTDLATLGPLQRELLGSALDAVRPGGVVAYSTCSPHPAETQTVVEDVLRTRSDVEQIDARTALAAVSTTALDDLGPGPWAQLWPHRHETDGMFLALLRRT